MAAALVEDALFNENLECGDFREQMRTACMDVYDSFGGSGFDTFRICRDACTTQPYSCTTEEFITDHFSDNKQLALCTFKGYEHSL